MVQMKQGQEYKRRDGAKVTQSNDGDNGVWVGSDCVWRSNSGKSNTGTLAHDIIAEWPSEPEGDKIQGVEFSHVWYGEEDTSDKPKTWGEMTDAEKGALLLAHQDGKDIEVFNPWNNKGGWYVDDPNWSDETCYRTRKEPVKGTVTLRMYCADGGITYVDQEMSNPTHRITFDTIDGKPDCASITMAAFGIEVKP